MEGFIDPILVNNFVNAARQITTNFTTLRAGSSGTSRYSFDPRRDIYSECGFPTSQEITPARAKDLYERDALAARVVEVWPKECWKVQPEIYEDEDSKVTTPFELGIQQIGRSLIGEPGYYEEDEGSTLLEYLMRADITCGIGRYGCILIGMNDGLDLDQPCPILPSTTGNLSRLQFLRVFDESSIQIVARQTDKNKMRFGQPEMYQINFDSPDEYGVSGSIATSLTSARVHWTRIVHIVDNILSNEIIGQYRVMPVLNDLLSAQKPRWGSGEMFWNAAQPKLSFETHPQLGGDVQINKDKMRQQMENVMRGLQQWWTLVGMSAKSISPTMTDPKPFVDTHIQSICIKTGVPLPIFIGYEVGENAGTMNTEEWNNRLRERHHRQITPREICPLINRLINIGILATPKSYKVYWPEITSNTAKDKAQLQSFRINTVVAYIKNNLGTIIPPTEFLVRFLDMSEDEARQLVEEASIEAKKQTLISTLKQPDPKSVDPSQTQQSAQTPAQSNGQQMNGQVIQQTPIQ